jgi:malonyl-CoA decarboxylase
MAEPSFVDRALSRLRRAWRAVAGRGEATPPRPSLPEDDARRLSVQMRACLDAAGGEVSARARAAELGRAYLSLDETGRRRFLSILAKEFDADGKAVDAAMDAVRAASTGEGRRDAERTLARALEAPRVRLLTQFNTLDQGIKFLVDMRAELLRLSRNGAPELAGLESDLKDLLAGWFDVGFLELRRITWSAPAALLEKLAAYEAVHAITSWQDLKNRLDSDRRCFAYFHPRMPDEPLIFVEVALVRGMADSVQTLLDEAAPAEDPRLADTAIFYSISNAQKGLSGISFGAFLIKRVAEDLQVEFPRLKTFATLSPIPGFRAWLDETLDAGALTTGEWAAARGIDAGDPAALKALLSAAHWAANPAATDVLRTPLMRMAARYLLEARRGKARARDPVAHFHLSNGARMERLNWMADRSPKGIGESCGLMINYLYRLEDIETNHEAYATEGRIAASQAVRGLVS